MAKTELENKAAAQVKDFAKKKKAAKKTQNNPDTKTDSKPSSSEKNPKGAGRKPLPDGQVRERVPLTLPPDLHSELRNYASSKHYTVSLLIEAALEEYMKNHP